MSTTNECPLCGKPIDTEDKLCEECRNHVDNQYTTDFLDKNNLSDLPEKDSIDIQSEEMSEATDVLPQAEDKKEENIPPTKKKRVSKTLAFILVGCVCIVIVGIIGSLKLLEQRKSVENEQEFWDSCVVVNTPLSYAKYLVTYQTGKYVDEAHERIRQLRIDEEAAWAKLKNSTDINDFYNYLSENPNTPYIKSARQRMDSLSWNTASNVGTADAYQAYIENVKLGNITGSYLAVAQEKYDYLSQMKTLEGTALDSIRSRVADLYLALSVFDNDVIENSLITNVNFYSDTLKSKDIVEYLKKDMKTKKLKKINYQANKNSLTAIKDNKGITFVELQINKEETNAANKKVYSVEATQLELNNENKVQSMVLKPKQ
jgi:hypothetical protein